MGGALREVASNWVVDDRAGATLVSYLASYLTKKDEEGQIYDYAAAVHRAKQLVRNDERWSSPFYWGGLMLVGPS